MKLTYSSATITLFLFVLFNACNHKSEKNSEVEKLKTLNIREIAGTMNLHPLLSSDELSGTISPLIFNTLTSIDFKTLEQTPLLADSLPRVTKDSSGLYHYQFTIREGAMWDNGSLITADDIAFSIKLNLLPGSASYGYNGFLESIVAFKVDTISSRTFTMISNMNLQTSAYLIGDIIILPRYHYDPNNLLINYTINQLNTEIEKISKDSTLVEFYKEFTSYKYQSDPSFISGSGAYKVVEINDGRNLKLKRKENWWGDNYLGKNTEFEANIDIINYQIIPDETTALSALKSESINLMRGISPKEFHEMSNLSVYKDRFNFVTSPITAYYCLGLNLTHPILKEKNNRKALAHLLDVDKIINIVAYGYGERIIGPNSKTDSANYNFDLEPYPFDIKKAKEILKINGWSDQNGDGILDKVIDGMQVPFELDYSYNSGNETRKRIGLIFQEDARKVGIKINILSHEWPNYIENFKSKKFEIAFIGKVFAPVPRNHYAIFHSNSITEASNYVSYSNSEVDQLVDLINVTTDKNDYSKYHLRFQEIIHDELPYLYLYAPKERMAISKKFTNYNLSAMRPGFWAPGFN